ncbi:uncharacterized protein J3D65DRAFT_640700 [Phyllosticta citribraziliensis]|uniref:NADPH-dependent diflavin oxidoreductase 1 n=1 Tax=Phyllosticta citribraziliensis TaxID=989973 RepID=A0ABR1L6D3_9PEZI
MSRSALVAYGSETGNAEELAYQVSQLIRRLRIWTTIKPLNAITPQALSHASIVVIVISTTGQGDLPRNAQILFRKLRSRKLPVDALVNCIFASFGLGDSSYPQFNWAHRKLGNRIEQLGARRLIEAGEADEQHPEGVDASFLPWLDKLRSELLSQFPLPAGEQPLSDDVFLKPRWSLNLLQEPDYPTNGHVEALDTPEEYSRRDHVHVSQEADHEAAHVTSNSRVTPESHWQDVRQIELSIPREMSRSDSTSGNPIAKPRLTYSPGDVVEIYPKNFPEDVNEFIELQGYASIALRPLELKYDYSQPDSNPPREHPIGRGPFHATLFGILTNHLDIMAVPRRSFFLTLSYFTSDADQKERLMEFARPKDPDYIEDYFDYATRPRRSILEVLQDFTTVKIPFEYLLGVIPPLKPRQFSIASADLTRFDPKDKDCKVTLLVALVKYRTVIKRIRWGVCSRYLSALQPGQKLRIQVLSGAMKVTEQDLANPSILVGPGTGVAALRSIIQEKEAYRLRQIQQSTPVNGDDHGNPNATPDRDSPQSDSPSQTLSDTALFFGNRNADADFFFGDEFTRLSATAGLHVITAFSRDQREKVYVQDRIREHASLLWRFLEDGARVYVCGSSGKMPEAVRAAIVDVIAKEGDMEREEADETVRGMVRGGRWVQETW